MPGSQAIVCRDATSAEVKELRVENARLKETIGDQALELQLPKKV